MTGDGREFLDPDAAILQVERLILEHFGGGA